MTPRSERTRAHLLDTALRLFTEQGYEGVRVEDIAREAGLSRAAFYKHFSERDEIIGELLDRLLAPTSAGSESDAGDGVEGDCVEGGEGGDRGEGSDGGDRGEGAAHGEVVGDHREAAGEAAPGHLDRAVGLLVRTAERMAAREALARFVYSLPVRPSREAGRSRPAVFGGVAVLVEQARDVGELRAGLDAEVVLGHLARSFEAGMRDWAEGRVDDASGHVRLLLGIAVYGVGP